MPVRVKNIDHKVGTRAIFAVGIYCRYCLLETSVSSSKSACTCCRTGKRIHDSLHIPYRSLYRVHVLIPRYLYSVLYFYASVHAECRRVLRVVQDANHCGLNSLLGLPGHIAFTDSCAEIGSLLQITNQVEFFSTFSRIMDRNLWKPFFFIWKCL